MISMMISILAAASVIGGQNVTPPVTWDKQPTPEYPAAALQNDVRSGSAQLRCAVAASGALNACQLISETPEGMGFGRAALGAVREARVTPQTVASSTDGAVTFTLRFQLS